jgi:O-antigen ligase
MHKVVKAMKDPRWFIGVSWPLVLIVPYLPGIPRPSLGGLAWRQELTFATLLIGTLVFVFKRSRKADPANFSSRLQHSPLLVTGICFTVWTAASMLWAANPYSAAHYAFTWAAYLFFFVLMHFVAARPRAMRTSFYALGIVIWLLSLACLIEWLGGAALTDHALRSMVKPLFRGFSGFGETMAVAAPIFGALALSLRNRRLALLSGATSLMTWLVIIQAFQRAPILGAAVGLVVFGTGILFFKGCRPRNLTRVALLGGGLVIIGVLQLGIFAASPGEDTTTLQRLRAASTVDTSTRVRLLYWSVGLEMFRDHPLLGVGANNYEVAFPAARERFAATHSASSLVELNEQLLTQYAHNEYVQILAELGLVGIVLFGVFCLFLARNLWRALRYSEHPLLALGSGAGMLAFAISSGASAFSFRWFGSGLMFFFAAALVSHLGATASPKPEEQRIKLLQPNISRRLTLAGAFAFAVAMFLGAGMQAINGVTHAWAQTASPSQAEGLYRWSLVFNPFDAASHFDYGSLLYHQRRYEDAVRHLRYAVEHGFNTSTSYAALAAAQEEAGDLASSERTLGIATRAYPHSIFILVRHAAALSRLGKGAEADKQFANALAIDSRAARGWYQLINFDIDVAFSAAQRDSSLAKPGELKPETAIYVVLKENERRLNIPATSGWRGRVGALAN